MRKQPWGWQGSESLLNGGEQGGKWVYKKKKLAKDSLWVEERQVSNFMPARGKRPATDQKAV